MGAAITEVAGEYEDYDTAKAYLKESEEDLQERAEELRDGMEERRTTNRRRVGPPHRTASVTPAMFTEAFGFRGVEFGNWTTGSDRQIRLNEAYDALMDLAGALGVPTNALSLGGKLGLAFGARGKGGRRPAAAHYEPDKIVINLTKNSGAGSLAHEWWHAIDNHLARTDASTGYGQALAFTNGAKLDDDKNPSFMSTRYRYTQASETNELPGKTLDAFYKLRAALRQPDAPWFKRSLDSDKAMGSKYYATVIELSARAFEKMVVDRLTARGMVNDFLANINEDSGAYPTSREMSRQGVTKALNGVMDVVMPSMQGNAAQTVTNLPPLDPALMYDGPQVGMEWPWAKGDKSGTRRVVARDGNRATVEIFDADGVSMAKLPEIDISMVETMIDEDAAATDPALEGTRQARKAAKARAEAGLALGREQEDIAKELIAAIIGEGFITKAHASRLTEYANTP